MLTHIEQPFDGYLLDFSSQFIGVFIIFFVITGVRFMGEGYVCLVAVDFVHSSCHLHVK